MTAMRMPQPIATLNSRFGKFVSTNVIIAFVTMVVIVGGTFYIWNGKQAEIDNISQQITETDTNSQHYETLISQMHILQGEYSVLAKRYLENKETTTALQAQFANDVAAICLKHHVEFTGLNFGTLNGSNPPVPEVKVDENGNANHATQALTNPAVPTTPKIVTNLGGDNPGDPSTSRPNIPASLFDRIPTTITITGSWHDLVEAMQDISRQHVLMSISDPDIKGDRNGMGTLSFTSQLLTPAILIVPELLAAPEQVDAQPRAATPTARAHRKASHHHHATPHTKSKA
jgi:Tfp pilus assembly protein PilO